MEQTYMQQQAHVRLKEIGDRAFSLTRYVQRCQTLVNQGLASDIEGLRSYEVVAQYAELMALQAQNIRVHADALADQLRTLKP